MEDLNGGEIAGMFSEKELQKANQREFMIKKVMFCDKLYFKGKGYDNSFKSWID